MLARGFVHAPDLIRKLQLWDRRKDGAKPADPAQALARLTVGNSLNRGAQRRSDAGEDRLGIRQRHAADEMNLMRHSSRSLLLLRRGSPPAFRTPEQS